MTQERDDNNIQKRNRIAAHWPQDSFFEHLDGRSQPRKPRVVMWMTCPLHVNGHRSSELFLFLTVVVRRVPLPQTWSSIFVISGCAISRPRVDVEEVNPNFVVVALICTPDAKRIVRDFRHHACEYVALQWPLASLVGSQDTNTRLLKKTAWHVVVETIFWLGRKGLLSWASLSN